MSFKIKWFNTFCIEALKVSQGEKDSQPPESKPQNDNQTKSNGARIGVSAGRWRAICCRWGLGVARGEIGPLRAISRGHGGAVAGRSLAGVGTHGGGRPGGRVGLLRGRGQHLVNI